MHNLTQMPVSQLSLDLHNFRTVQQSDEEQAINAMISISPERFWALMTSLLEEGGYLPTENIIVLRSANGTNYTVKEGNRRVAALKISLGLIPLTAFSLPSSILDDIKSVSDQWRVANAQVPCTIYEASEAAVVDRIVTLAHGKGEKAARDQWNAVARARHYRDMNGASQPELDLLEKYLRLGQNITPSQARTWAGDYAITILDEAMRRLVSRCGVSSPRELADGYPLAIQHCNPLEAVLNAIGLNAITFKIIRDPQDFAVAYGFPPTPPASSPAGSGAPPAGSGTPPAGSGTPPAGSGTPPAGSGTPPAGSGTPPAGSGIPPAGSGIPPAGNNRGRPAYPTNDPRSVAQLLRSFRPAGPNRQKVADLIEELRRLKIDKTPLAFCFVVRSLIEISAKAYCADHTATGGPSTQSNGRDKTLVVLLRDIINHMTTGNMATPEGRRVHGAMIELARPDGILSVTSMNQLVHNPHFSIMPTDICILFNNLFPLVEALNQC